MNEKKLTRAEIVGKIFSIACDSPSACLGDCMRQIVSLLERGIS
jgi:hypothetical protein